MASHGNLTSEKSAVLLPSGSAIRKAFEQGRALKAQFGADKVFDFSLGNPALEPPKAVLDAIKRVATQPPALAHAYTPNPGLPTSRAACSRHCVGLHPGCGVVPETVVVTPGAAAALSVFLRTVCDAGDEVILIKPYFCGYLEYIMTSSTVMRTVECDASFDPDMKSLREAINSKTRVVLINSPNNPAGRVYSQAVINEIGAILKKAEKDLHQGKKPIWLLSDEPYARLVYATHAEPKVPTLANVFEAHDHAAVATSFSKDLSIPGERLGYLALSPRCAGGNSDDLAHLIACAGMWVRALGFVNAPATMQLIIPECVDAVIDVSWYDARRKAMCDGLRAAGLKFVEPAGALYILPEAPAGMTGDELQAELAKRCVLCVDGAAFGMPQHVRFCFAVQSIDYIKKGMEITKEVLASLRK
eukprot:m51a1_g10985 putative aspartate aminotransferase (417) ;mRNA; r:317951-319559